jgi:hypothetical protein
MDTVKHTIPQLRLLRIEDLKEAVRDCFNGFQESAWKMSGRTRGGGGELKLMRRMERSMHRDFVASMYVALVRRVLLQKLTVAQPVKKFSTFHETRNSVSVFISSHD